MPKVDLAAYAGREQAYVKHYLFEKYLAPLVYKVGSKWNSIVYIDAFSGPWQTTRKDHADSSFAIAIEHCAKRVAAYWSAAESFELNRY